MNSEQLGALVAAALQRSGGAPPHVAVRRADPASGADLLCGALRSVPVGRAESAAAVVAEHPDVERAEVVDGTLVVRLRDEARARLLLTFDAIPRGADLRPPDRLLRLGPGSDTVTAAEGRRLLGSDAVTYELARAHRPGATGPLRVDVPRAVRRTADSPLFAVQHAHARATMLRSRAARLDVGPMRDDGPAWERRGPVGALVASLLELPATLTRAERRQEIRVVPRHLEEIAGLFADLDPERSFLPSGDDEVTTTHRVGVLLAAATRDRLARGLRSLGVEAPPRI